MLDHELDLFQRLFMQSQHLTVADRPVESTGDQIRLLLCSLCLFAPSLQLELGQQSHQVVHSEVNVHQVGLTKPL